MVGFMESVLVEGYLDRQPDLLSTLYDELDLERPVQLRQLFSPTGQPPSSPHSIIYIWSHRVSFGLYKS
jgi:hypothetical protein